MNPGRVVSTTAIAVLLVAMNGCGAERAPTAADGAKSAAPAKDALVVYADRPDGAALDAVFAAFTEQTGVPVSIRETHGPHNVVDVVVDRDAPPPDVVLTDNLADIWLDADDGALRKLPAESGIDAVSAPLKDPDSLWVAVSVDPVMIAQSATAELPAAPDFAADYAEQLCIGTSDRAGNVALVGYLIDELGTRDAEILVRRWLGNLARPPHSTAAALFEDIDDDICGAAIVTGSEIHAAGGATETLLLFEQGYFSGFGVGIGRHARDPENAARLVAWLLDEEGQQRFASATGTRPLSANDGPADRRLTTVGWQRDEVRRLAERARWP